MKDSQINVKNIERKHMYNHTLPKVLPGHTVLNDKFTDAKFVHPIQQW